jgi:uncharacterized protein (TIGR03435 family)
MRKWMLRMIVFAALPAGALLAQNLAGTWQGTLAVPQAPNGQLRTVFKISRADDETLKGVFYSIDQGGRGLPTGAVTLQGSAVKIPIPGIGGTFEGKLAADGNSIAGTWTQGPMPLTLNLTRATTATAWVIPEPPPPPKMMAANANPVFEVATIKPSDPNRPGKLFSIRGTEVITINTTVDDLVTFAYNVHVRQIVGAPAWAESDKFDVTGKPEGGALPNLSQFRVMIQKLLADRFQLAFHHDKKELTVYAITVGKNGARLTKSESAGTVPALLFQGLGNLPARNATMEEFAGVMQGAVLDRPVVDQTELTGRFDFQLRWTPDETQFAALRGPGPPPTPPVGTETYPDLFTAIQQQLGLKMVSTKAPTDVLVIDKVEKPSGN